MLTSAPAKNQHKQVSMSPFAGHIFLLSFNGLYFLNSFRAHTMCMPDKTQPSAVLAEDSQEFM